MNATGPRFSLVPIEKLGPAALIPLYQACADFIRLATDLPINRAMVQADLDYSVHSRGIFQAIQVSTGEIIGVVDSIPFGFQGNPKIGFINLLMISPLWRRKGLGAAVLQEVERSIWIHPGVDSIQLAVQINNPEGDQFWLKQGYRRISEPALQPDGTTTCTYQKDR